MFQWFALMILIGCVSISAYYRYRARKESGTIPRRSEGTLLVATRILVTVVLAAALIAHFVNPSWMAWASFASPEWVRWIGVILGLITVPVSYWVFSSLGRNVSETVLTKQHHELVTKGPYRWVRHPLYSTGLALLLAIGLMVGSWLVLVFTLSALLLFRLVVVPLEERQLIRTFGDAYRELMSRTGRFVPRVTTRKSGTPGGGGAFGVR